MSVVFDVLESLKFGAEAMSITPQKSPVNLP